MRRLWNGFVLVAGCCLCGTLLVGLGVLSVREGVDGWQAQHGGVRGTFTVAECDLRRGLQPKLWKCSGTFASDDGSVQVRGVLDEFGRRRGGDRVRSTVAGADSHDVWPSGDSNWWTRPASGLAVSVGGIALSLCLWRLYVSAPTDRPRRAS